MQTYTLKVENIIQETDDTATILFKQPALKKVKYQAGQYLTLIFRINGRRYIRPYSFSSAPGIDSTLNVTIKRVQGGVVSNHILDRVKVGDLIEVMPPMGDFVLDNEIKHTQQNHIILWGSGSGITPLISIAKFALYENIYSHITLVYGNKSFETTIFLKEIAQLQQKYSDKLSVWHFHTQSVVDDLNPYVIKGRINPLKVLEVMRKEKDIEHSLHYICGPIGLKESVKSVLNEIGISSQQIFAEDFEITRNPEDFKDIITQNVALTVDNVTSNIEVVKGKSILEAGLDAGLELAYSCQTGSCLLCRAKLITGQIKTIGIKYLPQELTHDERLLCCSFPMSDNVSIHIENN